MIRIIIDVAHNGYIVYAQEYGLPYVYPTARGAMQRVIEMVQDIEASKGGTVGENQQGVEEA